MTKLRGEHQNVLSAKEYTITIPGRTALDFPYGTDRRVLMPDGGITGMVLSDNASELVLAAAGTSGRVRLEWNSKQENFLSGEVSLESSIKTLEEKVKLQAKRSDQIIKEQRQRAVAQGV